MIYPLLADLVLIIHLGFVVFVLCGGLLVLRWPWIAWLHLPAAAWGAVVEFTGWICPLTPLENWLREQGGGVGDEHDFLARYLLPILYPEELTRDIQWLLGTVVIAVNAAVYWWLWHRQAHDTARYR
ncbi:MAG: DUF2784 domain-containing protein [Nitrospirae bacterium]|nr:DUF2784 domain-containing protein [Nitrospirota bacterium]